MNRQIEVADSKYVVSDDPLPPGHVTPRMCIANFAIKMAHSHFLAEMQSVLVLALEVMNKEAKPLGLTINWAKTKIQTTDTTVFSGTLISTGWWKQCGDCRYLHISWFTTP